MKQMKKQQHLTLLAASLLLAGCGSLVPPREHSTPPLREDFRPAATAGTAVPADLAHEWDGFFADVRLRQVVGIALAQNRSLRASAAAVERVRAQYRIAEAERIPDLNASAAAGRQRAAGGATASSYSVSLGLPAYEIDLFDRLGSLEGAALARYLAQQETQRSARLSLVAEVANAWLTLAAEQQRLQLAEQLRDSQQRSLNLTEQRHQLGAASGLERARARTAYEAARGEATRSLGAVTQARLQLELLAGQPLPDALLPAAQAQQAVTALPAIPPGLPAELLLQRPDLRAAEQQLQAAAFDVGAARAARFPRLTLTASAGTRSPELDGLFKSGSGFWSLLPQLDLPLFDGGARAAQVEVSEAGRSQALAGYEAALQSAFREVADALALRDGLAERLQAQQAQVEAAEQSLRLAESSYRLGGSSQLELLDAQRQLATAQQGLVNLRQTEQANRVALLRTLGGRWSAEGR
ncbi:efflux transporter outer membrane subunit [Roseateles sp. DAIF2]|uniref:efflux transporter outer membrane subunit n=1 Tax=Roseateles sp. DAIF2 TaxID=2714952 RepID=UPI0018A32C6D|nr:efflux transporter outer membrane subunit [Roseateles sp. DAIF2]QPF74695.1 efflux transporter outer membrane subunit [Roseateles sp. DAIF2]